MDANLNALEKEDLIKLILDALKRIKRLEAELLRLTKRVQVLEP